jgi:hypothetical protein
LEGKGPELAQLFVRIIRVWPSTNFGKRYAWDKDHKVVLTFPQLEEGTELQLTVEQVVVPQNLQPRKPGSAKGQIQILPGFDDPLEEFEDYR